MRILVSGATATMRKLASTKAGASLGHLHTPQNGNSLGSLLRSGLPWAVDNSAYSMRNKSQQEIMENERLFWNLAIDAWSWMTFNPPAWVAVPDSVGNHSETLRMFHGWSDMWSGEIGFIPFPLAFVLQNGAAVSSVPWDEIAAVFVGGDDDFKLKMCSPLVEEAKHRRKIVHVGRVNSLKRLRYAMELGADTVDGSGFSMFPNKKIPRAVRFIERNACERLLF
jgi:hypothetical protein